MGTRALGRGFGWLWAAYSVSTFGTWLAFNAFPLIAVLVLQAGAAAVSLLAAAGQAVGAAVAVPLGSWVEFRRKRAVMVGMDLTRFAALLSVPAAFAIGLLTFAHLLVVSVVVAAADIVFRAAAGACVKSLVGPEDLLVANSRFETTTWLATAVGPPIGTAAIGFLGPVVTVVADAVSYLFSAFGIRAIGRAEPAPAPRSAESAGVLEGWRYLRASPELRPLLVNTVLVNGLIMATAPLLTVMMLVDLGFEPWQYGLVFTLPCLGGLIGARVVGRLVERFGQREVLLAAGVLRVCWPVGLAFVGPGLAGLLLVVVVEFGLIACVGVFTPLAATYRLRRIPADRVTRALAAWSVTTKAGTAALTALWGVLAGVTGPRVAIAVAGVLLLATPLLFLGWETAPDPISARAGNDIPQ
ncbi:MFS transporter [Actinokineospora cianjurensis]|uniref:Putative MFS family arabinose efflux permease n=1 Tax=Actinokineospora cianjurensis TaxID=585224 RepID=A0A421B3Q1_9PSEU|nr:MFS transporter [Actinokineospora cianjurensis]RLK58955.1 putative MFS family arabinose efflux permease [Actinokineospora cianjurensis]